MRSPYVDDRKHSALEVLEHALVQFIADGVEPRLRHFSHRYGAIQGIK